MGLFDRFTLKGQIKILYGDPGVSIYNYFRRAGVKRGDAFQATSWYHGLLKEYGPSAANNFHALVLKERNPSIAYNMVVQGEARVPAAPPLRVLPRVVGVTPGPPEKIGPFEEIEIKPNILRRFNEYAAGEAEKGRESLGAGYAQIVTGEQGRKYLKLRAIEPIAVEAAEQRFGRPSVTSPEMYAKIFNEIAEIEKSEGVHLKPVLVHAHPKEVGVGLSSIDMEHMKTYDSILAAMVPKKMKEVKITRKIGEKAKHIKTTTIPQIMFYQRGMTPGAKEKFRPPFRPRQPLLENIYELPRVFEIEKTMGPRIAKPRRRR